MLSLQQIKGITPLTNKHYLAANIFSANKRVLTENRELGKEWSPEPMLSAHNIYVSQLNKVHKINHFKLHRIGEKREGIGNMLEQTMQNKMKIVGKHKILQFCHANERLKDST